jgi:formate/nitrite transporter FocA (FNT family)
MVAMGVVMGYVSTSTIGKIVALWLPVFTFFALGLEHCVVNMFVIPTAILFKANISMSDWWIWNQIPVIIGNIVGGCFFTGILLYLTYHKKATAIKEEQVEAIPKIEQV